MKKLVTFLIIASVAAFSAPAFALDIDPYDNPNSLAQALVGSGVSISNVSYTGATAASGYFEGGDAAGIGIESGIVLTSGAAFNLNGISNTSGSITGNNGLGGDADLSALVGEAATYDATVLEFDFVSSGDAAYFNYAFGSEEYNEYVDSSFNDVFGFFLDGSNVALIPDTNTPVSINTVNNDDNSEYYNDNDPGDNDPVPYPFEYDGFTSVLTAELSGLTAGQTYHLKLAIADVGDHVYDSGVFLEAGSFTDVNPVPEPATMLLLGSGLIGLAGFRRKFKKS